MQPSPAAHVNGHLVVFARPPLRGRVKRRLAAAVGEDTALELYRAFLLDTLALARRVATATLAVEVCFAEAWTPDAETGHALTGLATTTQGPGDLGRRLAAAFARSRVAGHAACVVIGTDSPTLPDTIVHDAFRALAGAHDAALAPADDGGFVLLGLRGSDSEGRPRIGTEALDAFFGDMPWGTDAVAARTLERAAALGASVAPLATGYDVDDATGLARLREDLADGVGRTDAPATRRALARL